MNITDIVPAIDIKKSIKLVIASGISSSPTSPFRSLLLSIHKMLSSAAKLIAVRLRYEIHIGRIFFIVYCYI